MLLHMKKTIKLEREESVERSNSQLGLPAYSVSTPCSSVRMRKRETSSYIVFARNYDVFRNMSLD